MNFRTSICLLLGTAPFLTPQMLQASPAQADLVKPQVVCDRCPIPYPEEARLSRLNGRVELLIDIDADGQVTNVRLTRSSGYSVLDESAVETAATWQFQPMSESVRELLVVIDYLDNAVWEEP
ncbi:MAG: energy transducer TonB [Leptolyngbyaceae cyanobacterium SL_5_14]|nr:energy transducer TonB [Leptolyngbyaceae cyanobacterium SL_5_14]NJO66951.1 energy transducer TonB [Leptolyngbyaceae cyanobacterium RM1_405_57]